MRFFQRSQRLNWLLTGLLVVIGAYLLLNIDRTTFMMEHKIVFYEDARIWCRMWLTLFLGRIFLQCIRKDVEEDLQALKGLIEEEDDGF